MAGGARRAWRESGNTMPRYRMVCSGPSRVLAYRDKSSIEKGGSAVAIVGSSYPGRAEMELNRFSTRSDGKPDLSRDATAPASLSACHRNHDVADDAGP